MFGRSSAVDFADRQVNLQRPVLVVLDRESANISWMSWSGLVNRMLRLPVSRVMRVIPLAKNLFPHLKISGNKRFTVGFPLKPGNQKQQRRCRSERIRWWHLPKDPEPAGHRKKAAADAVR